MPSRIFGSLSMHSTTMLAGCPASTRCGPRGARQGSGDRHLDREVRTAAGNRREIDLVVEHTRNAFDDRQPEAEAARDLGALVEAMELAEDRLLLRLRNADAGVVDVDAQASGVASAADQHAAL